MELIVKIKLNIDRNKEIARKFFKACLRNEVVKGDELLPYLKGSFYVGAVSPNRTEAQITLIPVIKEANETNNLE